MPSCFNRTTVALVIIAFFAIPASAAQAQALPIAVGGISLTASTDDPTPGQNVTITAQSYSIDINSASISWNVNGKSVQKGTGLTTLVIKAPDLGKKTIVSVTASPQTGATVSSAITIISGAVDMIVENNGFVPAFFKGKIAASYQNTVTISAIPHLATPSGIEYDPKTLVYQWQRNSQAIQDQSGYGKQSVIIPGDLIPRPYSVSVVISTRDHSAQATGRIAVTPQAPSIGFYVDDPLYGPLFNSQIADTIRIGSQKETGVRAVPFGFNIPVGQDWGPVVASWLVNGDEHPELASNKTIVLRAPESSAGTSNVELDLENPKLILQTARSGFSALYDTTGSAASTSSATF